MRKRQCFAQSNKANLISDGSCPWNVEPVVVASLFFVLLSSLCAVVMDARAESSENLGLFRSVAFEFDSADGESWSKLSLRIEVARIPHIDQLWFHANDPTSRIETFTLLHWQCKFETIFAEDYSSQIDVFYTPPLCSRCGSLRGLVPRVAVEPPRVVKLGRTAPSTMEVDLVNPNRVSVPGTQNKTLPTYIRCKLYPHLFDIYSALSTISLVCRVYFHAV